MYFSVLYILSAMMSCGPPFVKKLSTLIKSMAFKWSDVRIISGFKSRFGQWSYEYYVFLLLSSLLIVIVRYVLQFYITCE